MTPMETLFAICRSLEATLKDFRFEDEGGKERPVTVYPFHFPEQVLAAMNPHAEDGYTPIPDTQDDAFQRLMPAVVVRPLSYEDKTLDDDSSILSMAVTVGVFSRDPANVAGSWGVVNVLERQGPFWRIDARPSCLSLGSFTTRRCVPSGSGRW
ncbi:hypothetical protein [uncultured Fretibacterium sp.]|uniref:hypothetical protein n=1 Tax=uncultured Fretibacterium sp. TaxID=1678694 RepID=UPI00260FF092|nr:hypothetical protein [uncultured Fretibacterium sp.]